MMNWNAFEQWTFPYSKYFSLIILPISIDNMSHIAYQPVPIIQLQIHYSTVNYIYISLKPMFYKASNKWIMGFLFLNCSQPITFKLTACMFTPPSRPNTHEGPVNHRSHEWFKRFDWLCLITYNSPIEFQHISHDAIIKYINSILGKHIFVIINYDNNYIVTLSCSLFF